MVLAEKIALVTGAGRGMGRAIALQYAQAGAAIAAVDVDGQTAQETSAAIEAAGGRSLPIQADVGELANIDRMVQQTVETFGRLDVMVNNAGVTRYLNIMEVTEADWDRIHRVNAKGVFFCMQAVAREMVKRKEGKIINIASIAGKGFRGTSNISYAGSKGAVIAMTRIGASQLARYNINVNAINPGATRTELYDRVMKEIVEREKITEAEAMARMDASIPLRRSNSGDDIANMAAFLASDEARNITGQSFNVDGGLMWD